MPRATRTALHRLPLRAAGEKAMITWIGKKNSQWDEPRNWSNQVVPTKGDPVSIVPGNPHIAPVIAQGAEVKDLTIDLGGQLSGGPLVVSGKFNWIDGWMKTDEIHVDTLSAVGDKEKHLSGSKLFVKSGGVITGPGLFGISGDGLRKAGLFTSGRLVLGEAARIAWNGGRPPELESHGMIEVDSGTDVSILGRILDLHGELRLTRGTLVVDGGTLRSTSQVSGVGKLRLILTGPGDMILDGDLTIPAESTFELKGGRISGGHTFHIDGLFLWEEGDLISRTHIRKAGVLKLSGTARKALSSPLTNEGTATIQGSGFFIGGNGQIINRGKFTALDPSYMSSSGGVAPIFENVAELEVPKGHFECHTEVVNAGSVKVGADAHFEIQSYNQKGGTTEIKGGRMGRGAAVLRFQGGELTGSGVIEGHLENSATLKPTGAWPNMTILGDYRQFDTGVLVASVDTVSNGTAPSDTLRARLNVSKQATLDGILRLEATPGYTPRQGLSIVPLIYRQLKGAFASEKGLIRVAPPSFDYVAHYTDHAIALTPRGIGTPIFPGFDAGDAPSNKLLRVWHVTSPYDYVGYYIKAPSQSKTKWPKKRKLLEDVGWALIPIYVGQQDASIPNAAHHASEARGRADALDATNKLKAGDSIPFPSGTVVYLDIERQIGKNDLDAAIYAYVRGWWKFFLVEDQTFEPGLYCHRLNFPKLKATIDGVQLQTDPGHAPFRFWIAGGVPNAFVLESATGPSDPSTPGVAQASMWQRPIAITDQHGNLKIEVTVNAAGQLVGGVDQDVALSARPAH